MLTLGRNFFFGARDNFEVIVDLAQTQSGKVGNGQTRGYTLQLGQGFEIWGGTSSICRMSLDNFWQMPKFWLRH